MRHRCPLAAPAIALLVLTVAPPLAPVLPAQESAGDPPDSTSRAPSTLVPLPALFHTPETGTAFGAAVGYFWYPPARGRAAQRMQPSGITALAVYTTKRQILTSLAADASLGGDHRGMGSIEFSKFPTKFWGVGNTSPDSAEEAYTPRTFMVQGEYQVEAWPGWRLGGTLRVGRRELVEVEDGRLLATGAVVGSETGWVSGIGLLASRDTRTNTVYPTSGTWIRLRGQWYASALGSDFAFAAVDLDARAYAALGGEHVVAGRVLGHAASGAVPFDLLPQLGGDVLLRGYYQGRFRDRVLTAAQVEFRSAPLWRVGLVAFAEVGRVAPDLGELALNHLRPAVGLGLRFRLVEATGLNLRADYGWGLAVGSSGLYINVGEAF